MKFDRTKFFVNYRREFGRTTQSQVDAIESLLERFSVTSGWNDMRLIAYAFATIKHETANTFEPITEYGERSYFNKYEGRRDLGNTQLGDGYRFRGRRLPGNYKSDANWSLQSSKRAGIAVFLYSPQNNLAHKSLLTGFSDRTLYKVSTGSSKPGTTGPRRRHRQIQTNPNAKMPRHSSGRGIGFHIGLILEKNSKSDRVFFLMP